MTNEAIKALMVLALYGVGNGATVASYPSDPPAGASDADCIVVIGTA